MASVQVVLREDVEHLGLRGEVVNVARGYARNYLLPRGLAETATPGLVRELERRDAQRARHEAQSVDEARGIATRLESAELRLLVVPEGGELPPEEELLAAEAAEAEAVANEAGETAPEPAAEAEPALEAIAEEVAAGGEEPLLSPEAEAADAGLEPGIDAGAEPGP